MTPTDRLWARVDKTGPCWLWTGPPHQRDGYGRLRIDRRSVYVHRLSWELAHGPVPDGLCVCHHCDTPLCVKPEHLFLGTSAENTRDSVLKGRNNRGQRNGGARLTELTVREIRALRAGGVRCQDLADRFGVSPWTIYDILGGRTWTHVPMPGWAWR